MKKLGLYIVFCWLFIQQVSSQESLTIDVFIAEVIANDFGIKIVKNEALIAENENNIGNAGYLPRISLDATQDLTINSARQEFLGNQTNEADNAQNTAFQFGALLDWTIFDGFKMFATDKKLDLLEENAKLRHRAEIEIKVYQAALLFYSYILQQEMQEIYQESISLSKARYDYIERRIENGAASKIEYLQAQMDLTADSAAFLNNEKELSIIKAELNQMMAREADLPLSIEGALPKETEILNVESFKEKALAHNSNLLLAKAEIAIAAQERKEVISRFYPSVGVYAGYNFNQAENEVGFLLRNRTYGPSFGITLRWDIVDQLSRFQDLKNVKISQENANYIEKQQQLIISKELAQAFSNLKWARKNMDFELRNQVARDEITKITEVALQQGSITPLELREIQFSAVEARGRMLQAQLDYVVAKLNLILTTGDFGNGKLSF
jgi:outer membrane protein TolC